MLGWDSDIEAACWQVVMARRPFTH